MKTWETGEWEENVYKCVFAILSFKGEGFFSDGGKVGGGLIDISFLGGPSLSILL